MEETSKGRWAWIFVVAFLVMLTAFCSMLILISHAMGPINVSGTVAAWDPSPTVGVDGYYIYYRSKGITTWSNGARSPKLPASARTFDLMTLGLDSGNWEICATATKGNGESGPSNIVPFVLEVPASPVNLRTQ